MTGRISAYPPLTSFPLVVQFLPSLVQICALVEGHTLVELLEKPRASLKTPPIVQTELRPEL